MGGGPVDIVGTWELLYDWGCDGTVSSTMWYFYSDGTFEDGFGSYGTYNLDGDQLTATYSNGTKYYGTVAGNYMSGTMVGYTGSTGCWEAYKTALASPSSALEGDSLDAAGN